MFTLWNMYRLYNKTPWFTDTTPLCYSAILQMIIQCLGKWITSSGKIVWSQYLVLTLHNVTISWSGSPQCLHPEITISDTHYTFFFSFLLPLVSWFLFPLPWLLFFTAAAATAAAAAGLSTISWMLLCVLLLPFLILFLFLFFCL